MFMKTSIYTHQYQSPLGVITLAATDKGLCLLEFDDEKEYPIILSNLKTEVIMKFKTIFLLFLKKH